MIWDGWGRGVHDSRPVWKPGENQKGKSKALEKVSKREIDVPCTCGPTVSKTRKSQAKPMRRTADDCGCNF